MNKSNQSYNLLPALMVGIIEGLIVSQSVFCFLMAKGISTHLLFMYTGAAVLFVAVLLAVGAYFTGKEEYENHNGESRILNIYRALNIDGDLKKAMIADSQQEYKVWENEWKHNSNATGNLSPGCYGLSIFSGFFIGGVIILTNNHFFQIPDYVAFAIPFLVLALLGFYKYKLSGQNPFTGLLLIFLSGAAAILGAYYAGSYF